MANMLHRICLTIIKREGRLIKSPRKACTLNPPCEGDLATWFNASFMALFPRPLCDGLLFLRLWLLYSSLLEKVSLGGVLDRCLYVVSSASSEEDSDPSGDRLRHARCNFFFNSSISHGKDAHRLGPSLLLRIQKTSRTGNDPELHLAKLSRVTRNIVAIGVTIRVHRTRALETKP